MTVSHPNRMKFEDLGACAQYQGKEALADGAVTFSEYKTYEALRDYMFERRENLDAEDPAMALSRAEWAARRGISVFTIQLHVRRLQDAGLIEVERRGTEPALTRILSR